MNLPRIEIRTQQGMLAARTTNARIDGGRGKTQIQIRGNNGGRIMARPIPPEIYIDHSATKEALNLEGPLRNIERWAARSDQKAIEQIGRIAREGVELMRIERFGGGDTAFNRIYRNKGVGPRVDVAVMDIPLPTVTAVLGRVEIQDVSTTVDATTYTPPDASRYYPGRVDISWLQRPFIDITVIPGSEVYAPDIRGRVYEAFI